MKTKNIIVEGFEDYRVQFMSDRVFYDRCLRSLWSYNKGGYDCKQSIVLYDQSVLVYPKNQIHLEWPETGNLDTAKKVYIHPNCTLSKQLVYTKYKRVLDPWKADVVVVPGANKFNGFYSYNTLLAVNECKKTVILCDVASFNANPETARNVSNANLLGEVISSSFIDNFIESNRPEELPNDIEDYRTACDAIIVGIYKMVSYRPEDTWLKELRDNKFPKNKIVYESSVMKFLSSEENKINFDILVNIQDMLLSKDEAVQSTGIKSLAMLDWANYPASVRYILQKGFDNSRYLRFNPMWHTTAVKFMKNSLSNMYSRYRPFSVTQQMTITKEDWNVLQELLKKNNEYTPSYLDAFRFLELEKDGSFRIIEP